ncbi:MAG TPA: nitrilase-related carbon-nitrogen hydrolase [Bacteroidales bacterium]|jgi:predicted amidohydrolase|nr:nitrilase family protein [Bacteroidales bacterium]HCM29945.1 nitrilase family protein [Bacteroidales bacterium]HNY75289.1 nitrilase-related carbon-nitrogen hydrolase [Bacteroidales bacterium]HOC39965.1 nitrilase-related carbon-nitrogen hydrolase [Bacteroidales bacterium]HOH93231.1 nitrilase-related carbon-nitrogen hydrolase [Bacteroidales bacterium]
MKNIISWALYQADTIWLDIDTNLKNIEFAIQRSTKSNIDILVCPEVCTTAYATKNPEYAQSMHSPMINKLKFLANNYDIAICGSFMINENDKIYNRFLFFTPDGVIYKYDKAHLFSLAEENIYFTKGKEIVTIPYLGWNIRPYICYDIRFPVFNRNRINNNSFDYDVLVYVSNWPTKRYNHWKHLLIARAIENQAYVIGVNRVGTDGNGFEYMGGTMCIDPVGNVILEGMQDENVYFVKTNYDNLVKIRQKLPFSKDWDDFDIK